MATNSITLRAINEAWKGVTKVWVAKITDLSPRTNFEREFLPKTAIVTEPGLYEVMNATKKDKPDRDFWLITEYEGELVKICLRDESAIEILRSGRDVRQLIVRRDTDGDLTIRDASGALMWQDRSSLLSERAKLLVRLAEIDAILAK